MVRGRHSETLGLSLDAPHRPPLSTRNSAAVSQTWGCLTYRRRSWKSDREHTRRIFGIRQNANISGAIRPENYVGLFHSWQNYTRECGGGGGSAEKVHIRIRARALVGDLVFLANCYRSRKCEYLHQAKKQFTLQFSL